MIQEEVIAAGSRLFVPMVTVTQALADGANRDEVQQVLRGARGEALDDFGTSLLAARLIIVTGHLDVVDATVAAEALRRVPSIVITSDAGDIRLLLDADPRGKRVEVWKV